MAHSDRLGAIEDIASDLSASSDLGAAMFKNTACSVSLVAFREELDSLLPTLIEDRFKMENFNVAMGKLEALVDKYKSRGLPELAREVRVSYLGMEVGLTCRDFLWEAQLKFWALLKQHSLGLAGGLATTSPRELVSESCAAAVHH